MTPTLRTFAALSPQGFHDVAYWEWGSSSAPRTLVCVHGLTRNGRDFDDVAMRMAGDGRYRVVCPDVAGRGRSAWLPDASLYAIPTYAGDMAALIARLDVEQVDWLGTSMGGLIGMALAAQPGSPIRRMVLNDVGPFLPKEALERIGAYVGVEPMSFDTMEQLEQRVRLLSASFGELTDAQWRHLSVHNARQLPDGRVAMAYDPKIGDAFRGSTPLADVDLWFLYAMIRCPVLSLRGEHSDLFSAALQSEMQKRKPDTEVVTFANCGHAPALMDPAQIAVIEGFLTAQDAVSSLAASSAP